MPNQSIMPKWLEDANAGKTIYFNSDGSISTVRTIGFDYDGTYNVAPTIRNIDGKTTSLSPQEAVDLAIKNKDYIPFNNQKEGDDFSQILHEQHQQKFTKDSKIRLEYLLNILNELK